MAEIKDIEFNWVFQDDFENAISKMREGDISLDYEGNSLDIFDEKTEPFSFSVTYLDNPELAENRFYFVMRKEWSKSQKDAFLKFVKSRKTYVFNVTYEGGLTWRYMGEFVEFYDTHCYIVIDAKFKQEKDSSGLKTAAALYFGVSTWAEIPWTCVENLQFICKFIRPQMLSQRISNLVAQFLSEYPMDNSFLLDKDRDKRGTLFISKLEYLETYLSRYEIYTELTRNDFDADKINLKSIPDRLVGPYCVYDTYWTAKLTNLLSKKWPWKTFMVYQKQAWASCLMQGYSEFWDIKNADLLIKRYTDYSILLYKTILKIPQFAEKLLSRGRTTIEKLSSLDSYSSIAELKDIWNTNSNTNESVNCFYDSLYSSQKFSNMMIANEIHNFVIQYDDNFILEISKKLLPSYKLLKFDIAEILKIEDVNDIKKFQDRWDAGETFKIPGSRLVKYNNYSEISSLFVKWILEDVSRTEDLLYKAKKCFKGALSICARHRDSLRAEMVEPLYDAAINCGYIEPTVNIDAMDWEFKQIYCLKFIKKCDKQLSTYLYGKCGYANVKKVKYGPLLKDLPIITDSKDSTYGYWELKTFPNIVTTKRWAASSHTIPWNCDVRGLLISRDPNNLVIHYDYSQSEVRLMAALAKCKALLEAFRNGADIHRLTAAGIWRKLPEFVTDSERRFAKMGTFSILYMATVQSFATSFMQGDFGKAQEIYDGFYNVYPEVKDWQMSQCKKVVLEGKVQTLFGDDIYIEVNPMSKHSVREAEKRSVNYPIQSSSSSIAGMCIWNLWKKVNSPANSWMQAVPGTFTHDSSDWEIVPNCLIDFIRLANETAVKDVAEEFGVTMAIDFEIGISQNHMMGIENYKIFDDVGRKNLACKFECHENSFEQIVDRLKKYYFVDYEVKKTKIKIDTLANAFKTRQGFSLDTGLPQKLLCGELAIISK